MGFDCVLSRVNLDSNHGRGSRRGVRGWSDQIGDGNLSPPVRHRADRRACMQAAEPSNLSVLLACLLQPLTGGKHRHRRKMKSPSLFSTACPLYHGRGAARCQTSAPSTAYILCVRLQSLWLQRLRSVVPRFATFLFCSDGVETLHSGIHRTRNRRRPAQTLGGTVLVSIFGRGMLMRKVGVVPDPCWLRCRLVLHSIRKGVVDS
jgi:hypothetical protein